MNAYEIARLARNRGVSTTELIRNHTRDGGTALAQRDAGACVFLGSEGCTVHPDRPLACRLYPLGRVVSEDGREAFVEVEPHPETAGEYSTDGSVADYLEQQDVQPYFRAADRYFDVYTRLLSVLSDHPAESLLDDPSSSAHPSTDSARWVTDIDAAVSEHCRRQGLPVPEDLEERVAFHLETIRTTIDRPSAAAVPVIGER